eukprot:TRINITY_DN5425_c0_g1_i1.p1 TRINITY_DN5425_c0_g1~~TRINITY_DN5425_c0_g1_i1.p1  ORF type:complete len:1127 (-),score=263.90 TRINITY_DN5425_c0_g1_i1:852-4136(-)
MAAGESEKAPVSRREDTMNVMQQPLVQEAPAAEGASVVRVTLSGEGQASLGEKKTSETSTASTAVQSASLIPVENAHNASSATLSTPAGGGDADATIGNPLDLERKRLPLPFLSPVTILPSVLPSASSAVRPRTPPSPFPPAADVSVATAAAPGGTDGTGERKPSVLPVKTTASATSVRLPPASTDVKAVLFPHLLPLPSTSASTTAGFTPSTSSSKCSAIQSSTNSLFGNGHATTAATASSAGPQVSAPPIEDIFPFLSAIPAKVKPAPAAAAAPDLLPRQHPPGPQQQSAAQEPATGAVAPQKELGTNVQTAPAQQQQGLHGPSTGATAGLQKQGAIGPSASAASEQQIQGPLGLNIGATASQPKVEASGPTGTRVVPALQQQGAMAPSSGAAPGQQMLGLPGLSTSAAHEQQRQGVTGPSTGTASVQRQQGTVGPSTRAAPGQPAEAKKTETEYVFPWQNKPAEEIFPWSYEVHTQKRNHRVRAAPLTESPIIGVVERGAIVTAIGRQGSWLNLSLAKHPDCWSLAETPDGTVHLQRCATHDPKSTPAAPDSAAPPRVSGTENGPSATPVGLPAGSAGTIPLVQAPVSTTTGLDASQSVQLSAVSPLPIAPLIASAQPVRPQAVGPLPTMLATAALPFRPAAVGPVTNTSSTASVQPFRPPSGGPLSNTFLPASSAQPFPVMPQAAPLTTPPPAPAAAPALPSMLPNRPLAPAVAPAPHFTPRAEPNDLSSYNPFPWMTDFHPPAARKPTPSAAPPPPPVPVHPNPTDPATAWQRQFFPNASTSSTPSTAASNVFPSPTGPAGAPGALFSSSLAPSSAAPAHDLSRGVPRSQTAPAPGPQRTNLQQQQQPLWSPQQQQGSQHQPPLPQQSQWPLQQPQQQQPAPPLQQQQWLQQQQQHRLHQQQQQQRPQQVLLQQHQPQLQQPQPQHWPHQQQPQQQPQQWPHLQQQRPASQQQQQQRPQLQQPPPFQANPKLNVPAQPRAPAPPAAPTGPQPSAAALAPQQAGTRAAVRVIPPPTEAQLFEARRGAEKEKDKHDRWMCAYCNVRRADYVFLECTHFGPCEGCVETMKKSTKCPRCGTLIGGKVKKFMLS